MTTFGGGRFYSFARWIFWKKIQVWTRTRLSHALALLLAVLASIREWSELKQLYRLGRLALDGRWAELKVMYQTGSVGFFDVFILVTILATLFALFWEFWGNKLTTSPQEIRFVTTMRLLLLELEKFIYGEDRDLNVEERLEKFMDAFLEVTANTLCGKTAVDGGVMLPTPKGDELNLYKWSKKAKYPAKLRIPLPDPPDSQETGPAGISYQRQNLVYMPDKNKKLGWPFEYIADCYEPTMPEKGWIDSSPEYERFRAVLCLPVAIYQKRNPRSANPLAPNAVIKRAFGVLNYSTNSRDPFVDRDFVMGECFSSILALVLETYRRERERGAQGNLEGHPAPP